MRSTGCGAASRFPRIVTVRRVARDPLAESRHSMSALSRVSFNVSSHVTDGVAKTNRTTFSSAPTGELPSNARNPDINSASQAPSMEIASFAQNRSIDSTACRSSRSRSMAKSPEAINAFGRKWAIVEVCLQPFSPRTSPKLITFGVYVTWLALPKRTSQYLLTSHANSLRSICPRLLDPIEVSKTYLT